MNGTVIKVMGDKRFGFIKGDDGREYFFHQSGFNGFFDDLVADVDSGRKIKVQFDVVSAPKGPRAENVTRIDDGV
jgi:cold shock protein